MDEILNAYSPSIAQKRMWDLLEHFVRFNDEEKINHVHLVNLGDSLDGILRMGQLQWIKLGNVDSAIEFAEFLSQWINQLSNYVDVDYYSVVGNHTELRLLDGKRGTFPEENMEKIISHVVWCNLKNNKNINIHRCKTHMYFDVLGTKVLAVHGHQEKSLEKSILSYPKQYGHPVDLQISGHLHHSREKTVGTNGTKDIKYIQCPSIIGIDHFSMEIKESAHAGAKLIVMREGQGETVHNIILN
jgi:predicted phosphodiesterase